MIEKKRLDCLVFEQGLASSREKARALIMAGQVYVDNQKADKPGTMLPVGTAIEVRGKESCRVQHAVYGGHAPFLKR